MIKIFNKEHDLTMVVAIIAVAFFLIEILTLSIAYFDANKQAGGDIVLGDLDFTINVDYQGENYIFPGDNVDIDISVSNYSDNKKNLVPFYFRFKMLEEQGFCNIILDNEDNFVIGGDYYYYKYKVEFNKTVKLIKGIYIPTNLTQKQSEDFDLQIVVEAVQSEFGAYKDEFPDAPIEWVTFIENN